MAKRVDGNQRAIISALREIGASVTVLSDIGSGCPDLLIGWHDHNILLEVKNLRGRGDRMTQAEVDWIERWKGQVSIVHDASEALSVLYGSNE